MRILLILLISIACFSSTTLVSANRPTNELYNFASNLTQSEIFKDNAEVSSYDGNVSFSVNDVVLPGNGDLEIRIGRKYDINSMNTGLMATYKLSSDWVALGPGWKMTGNPRIWSINDYWFDDNYFKIKYHPGAFVNLCNKYNVTDSTFIDLPDGSTERLYAAGSNTAKTKNNWIVKCLAGEVSATSPAGIIYKFGHIDSDTYVGYEVTHARPFIGYPDENVPEMGYLPDNSFTFMSAKEAIDLSGNWLKYSYKYHGNKYSLIHSKSGPLEIGLGSAYDLALNSTDTGGALLLSTVESSDGRLVNFEYDSVTGRLKNIKKGSEIKVNYTYKNLKSPPNYNSNNSVLATVDFSGVAGKFSYDYFDTGSFSSVFFRQGVSDIAYIDDYDDGRLSKITFPSGGWISYNYEKFNIPRKPLYIKNSVDDIYAGYRGVRLKEKRLSTGEVWTYNYAREKGKPSQTKISGPLGEETNSFYSVPYVFDSDKNSPNSSTWLIGKPIETLLPSGSKITYEWIPNYLSTGSTEFVFEEGYISDRNNIINRASLSKKTIIRDGATYTTEYKDYDAYGNPTKVIETGPNGGSRTTNLTYFNDTAKWIIGKLKDETLVNGTTTVSTIKREYDGNGKLILDNRDGVSNAHTYDAQGNVATSVNPNGAVTTYSNYKRGIPQKEEQPESVTITRAVDDAGNVSSETNAANNTTSYSYDGLNRVTSITPPKGDKTTISYTSNAKTTTRGDLIETTNYDGFDRPKDTTRGGIKTTFTYDAFDNKTFESNPDSTQGTTYVYDALDRVKTIINPDNSSKTYTYGAGTTEIKDERGNITKYTYKSYGNPYEQYVMSIATPVSAASITITRNDLNLIRTVKQGNLSRTYSYNDKYQLTSVVNPETGTTTYGRDNVGNMTSLTVGSSPIISYDYDQRNRLRSINYPSGTSSVTQTYTKTDKLDTVTNSTATRKFAYDVNDNLSSETLTIDGNTLTTSYAYNSKDQLSSITYPRSGQVVDYAPDALGKPTKVGSYLTAITYWPSGQFKQLTYGNGTVSNYGQNDRLWPTNFDTKKASTVYLNSSYSYDGQGNLLSIADTVDSNFNRTSTYDAINRLVTAQGPWGAGSIDYDGLGNITKQSFGSVSLNYNYDTGTNRLTSTSGLKAGSYGYDAKGNISNGPGGAYTYNAASQLICIECSNNSKKIEYSYDGLGKRASVLKSGIRRYEVLSSSGDQLIEFVPSQNNKLTEFIYLGGKRIAQRVTP